jgi:hypothetical protein
VITEQILEQRIREAVAAEGARHARYREVLMRGARASLVMLGEAKRALEQVQRRAFMPPDTRIAVENALGRVVATETEFEILLAGLEADWVKPTPASPAGRPYDPALGEFLEQVESQLKRPGEGSR